MWTSTNPADMLDSSTTTAAVKASSNATMSLSAHLDAMIAIEGAGAWPPQPARPSGTSSSSSSSCTSWWDPYHTLALHAASSGRFVDSRDGLHPHRAEHALRERIDANRRWLADELAQRVPPDVDEAVMQHLEDEQQQQSSSSSCLGLLACLAYLAHLYRWGTLPVVALAQDERELTMPREIERPWGVLRARYGLRTSGGCLWTMTLLNVNPHDDDGIVYSNMRHLRDTYPDVWDAERLNALIFYDMERLALPFYRAIAELADDDNVSPVDASRTLCTANTSLKAAFKLFFDTVREGRIKKDVWMSHAQGFHGWGLDDFDGVSGDHSLLIRTLDAFLAIPKHTIAEVPPPHEREGQQPSPPPTSTSWSSWLLSWLLWRRAAAAPVTQLTPPPPAFTEVPYSDDYLPTHQVAWIAAVRRANLRARLARDAPDELAETVRLLRLWRAAHTRKAVYYENLDLPERRPMTASGGVGGGVGDGKTEGVEEMIRKLEARLKARIEATQ